MIYGQPVNIYVNVYMIIFKKNAIIQEDGYTKGCLLDYNYFKN